MWHFSESGMSELKLVILGGGGAFGGKKETDQVRIQFLVQIQWCGCVQSFRQLKKSKECVMALRVYDALYGDLLEVS